MRSAILLALACASCVDSGLAPVGARDSAAGGDEGAHGSMDQGARLDLAGAPDAATADLAVPDLATLDLARPDLAGGGAHPDVNCGAAACTAPTNVCCRAQPFGPGQCIRPGGPCATQKFACDDPADCAAGLVCCVVPNAGSSCVTAAACTGQGGAQGCQMKSDCPANEMCCGVGPTPDYRCMAGGCPISRARYKRDIRYLDGAEEARLRDELLGYPLARWRYRAEPDGAPPHLGFVIDDVVDAQGRSPSVRPDGETVDLYGYTSMAVAALKAQQRELAALRREVAELRRQVAKGPGAHQPR